MEKPPFTYYHLVHKLDRFSRNRYDSAMYKRELKKNGVSLYSVLENLDDSPESIMMEAVLEGMAEYYSQNLARETMKGMRETALQCKHTGGKPPLGYDVDPVTKKLVINEQEAEWVRLIFKMYANGEGYSAILKELDSLQARTKRGTPFEKNSITSLIRNRKYAGIYIFNRAASKGPDGKRNNHSNKDSEEIIEIPGGCPQIVDSVTFERVQHRLCDKKRWGGRNGAKEVYLLSGKVFCKDCGKSMTGCRRKAGRNQEIYSVYQCHTRRPYCQNREISKKQLETYVLQLLEKEIFNQAAMEILIQRIDAFQERQGKASQRVLQQKQKQLEQIESELQNVTQAIAKGIISETLVDKINRLEEQKRQLLQEMAAPQENKELLDLNPLSIPGQYGVLKRNPESKEYKMFISSFVERIEVGHFNVIITIRTGLEICDELNATVSVGRQELFEREKS